MAVVLMYLMTVTSFTAVILYYFEHLHFLRNPCSTLPGCRQIFVSHGCFKSVWAEERHFAEQKPSALGESRLFAFYFRRVLRGGKHRAVPV